MGSQLNRLSEGGGGASEGKEVGICDGVTLGTSYPCSLPLDIIREAVFFLHVSVMS